MQYSRARLKHVVSEGWWQVARLCREARAWNSGLGSWISYRRNEELLKTFGDRSKMISSGVWKNDPQMWRVSFRKRSG